MSKTTKIIQIVVVVAIVAAGINLYLTVRERKAGLAVAKQPEVALDPDYYVTPKKLHPQDLKDAKELTKQPVWVRDGYRYAYYSYAGHSDFEHPVGTLGPIEKLDIKDVVLDRTPGSPSQKQVMAVFERTASGTRFPSASTTTATTRSTATTSSLSRTRASFISTGPRMLGRRSTTTK